MSQERKVTYEPQFPNIGFTDTVRPISRCPAVERHPDGTTSSGKGLIIEELGIDEMKIGLLKPPLSGDAFGGQRVTDSSGQLISWSVFLVTDIDDDSRVVLGDVLSSVSDAKKRKKLQTEIRNSLPHLIVGPEEGIYLQLKNGNRLALTDDGVVIHEISGNGYEDHSLEEGNTISIPMNDFFDSVSVPAMLSKGEVEVQLDYSGTPDEILQDIRALLKETDFNSEEERIYFELELKKIISPVVRIYPE